ncbi:hypothetical protein KC343_g197 [Hortaea werneckii]|uniref:Nuclear rim protein 1 n=1 Tax=Hortaea werneckii TaxID=91943 RepID=A0A3M7F3X4_HORWE|nr:hypothetical protein KC317_g2681 [Hortaea werneckii]KAI7628102.1 hypothetical protein KC346_g395 [Hortaea werneckii]KAI7638272.1 hypothetical protein KC343_g197 [Hortaea werneckii]KAI7683022.1 hypothetical protein KC319_g690 [Hortaea werneckii]KAI7723399.1 hypothetical protein KC322_g1007 [Hortaea werneckii]
MPPLIRRAPLSERLKAYLDPYDLLLWLSEELDDDTYDEFLQSWATPVGVVMNIVFILARGASKTGTSKGRDDVFGDTEGSGSGWFSWLATFLVHLITLLCCLNAFYTFLRKRHYRLFEQPVDTAPATPSAHRVRVDSSPMSSSPLRYLQNIVASSRATSRAYPDAQREVWELSVWDPKPANLTIFTLFSPGHLLLYASLLPPATLDPRPSMTVFTALAFGVLLSIQLILLKNSFSQQSKDSALVHGEVMNEYDTKFVRPNLNRPVRDVGVQTRESATTPRGTKSREVDVYTPTTIVNRGFRTNPNPNYANQYDPDHLSTPEERPTRQPSFGAPRTTTSTPNLTTPTKSYVSNYTSMQSRPPTAGAPAPAEFPSPSKPHHERLRERSPVKGNGGSMGVYNHAASPLRKSSSHLQLRNERPEGRPSGSPLKRMSMAGSSNVGGADRARRRETGRF